MTTIELRTEIMRLLREEENTSILEAIRLLLRREEAEEDIYTEDDIAELDRRREERLQSDVPAHGVDESLRLAREGYKG
jgi:predicted Zn-ribbon and HTH transcriptional regulator